MHSFDSSSSSAIVYEIGLDMIYNTMFVILGQWSANCRTKRILKDKVNELNSGPEVDGKVDWSHSEAD